MIINPIMSFSRPQQGVALITGLIFMVVLTLIAITAARMAGLEERMSGNMRDRSMAMQAAEMTLRDAERDILGGVGISRAFPIAGNSLTPFSATCLNGLCYNGPYGKGPIASPTAQDWNVTPVWTLVSMTGAPSVAYGTYTGATLTGLSSLPRYIIEAIYKDAGGGAFFYRITVRAQGVNPNTVVWLQEVYKPF